MSTYTTYSDIDAVETDANTLMIEPLGVDLHFTIVTNLHRCDYAEFSNLEDLFDRDDVSLSASEKNDLLLHLDAVARGY